MKLIQLEQGSESWLQWRKEHIGSSDSSSILGLNPWSNPISVWEEKCLGWSKTMNDNMRRGQMLEPLAREAYQKLTELQVEPMVAEHETIPFLSASFDGVTKDLSHSVEIKCGASSHRAAKQGIVPAYYLVQLNHLMIISCHSEMDYFSFDGEEGILIKVKRDDDLIKRIIDANIHFWQHVLSFTPPEEKCCNWTCSLTKEI